MNRDSERKVLWRKRNIEKARNIDNRYRIRKKMIGLGSNEAEYLLALKNQHGLCAICEKESIGLRLSIDHDHKNNRFRGLLCGPCNRALGLFKDNADIVLRAAAYLDSHKNSESSTTSLVLETRNNE